MTMGRVAFVLLAFTAGVAGLVWEVMADQSGHILVYWWAFMMISAPVMIRAEPTPASDDEASQIARARQDYAEGRIEAEDFEAALDDILR